MTTKEIIEVIEAADKKLPLLTKTSPLSTWVEATGKWSVKDVMRSISDHGWEFRIKPTPSKRLIRADELPAMFWVREKGMHAWFVPLKIEADENGKPYIEWDPRDLKRVVELKYAEWSPDRKEVRSFYVEES